MNASQQAVALFYLVLIARARQYLAERVTVDEATGCWIWSGCNDGRYGHAYFMGQRFKAHVLAFLAYRGRVPRGKILDHKECDCTRCCCPEHLAPVTQSQNMKRCFAVGRGKSPFLKVAHD